jgi:acylphosphatase
VIECIRRIYLQDDFAKEEMRDTTRSVSLARRHSRETSRMKTRIVRECARMRAKRIHFEGRVQGVGFRYQTKQIAMGFEVTGWVQNLPDGRVEMEVMGPGEEVEAFLAAIEDSDLNGLIRKREILDIPPVAGLRGFEIRR